MKEIIGFVLIVVGILGMVIASFSKIVVLVTGIAAIYAQAGIGAVIWAIVLSMFTMIGFWIIGIIFIAIGATMLDL